jgi:hypothetical protein
MTKFISSLMIVLSAPFAMASSARPTISGKVKSFTKTTVTIERDKRLYEFDIKRVMDRKKLRQDALIELSLE